jgi:hypothetical protein
MPAVRDFTRDRIWSTYDVSVRKKRGGGCTETGYPLKLPSPTNLARLGHFPPVSQAGRLAGPVFYVYVFYLVARKSTVQNPFPPSFKCNVLRESLSVDSQNISCATL